MGRHLLPEHRTAVVVTAVVPTALALYVAGVAGAFGVRTWLHVRRTGRSGFHGISGQPGSPPWWGGVLFVLALLLGVAAPVLALVGVVTTPAGPAAAAAATVGLVLLVLGIAAVLAAQSGMGTSWRIGVDEAERTDLVTTGVFAVVRNPIFTAMAVVQTGLVLAVPSVVALAAFGCLLGAVQLQVRLIEEPYLQRVHGATYRAYAARTGRFVPGMGRLRPPTGTAPTQRPRTT